MKTVQKLKNWERGEYSLYSRLFKAILDHDRSNVSTMVWMHDFDIYKLLDWVADNKSKYSINLIQRAVTSIRTALDINENAHVLIDEFLKRNKGEIFKAFGDIDVYLDIERYSASINIHKNWSQQIKITLTNWESLSKRSFGFGIVEFDHNLNGHADIDECIKARNNTVTFLKSIEDGTNPFSDLYEKEVQSHLESYKKTYSTLYYLDLVLNAYVDSDEINGIDETERYLKYCDYFYGKVEIKEHIDNMIRNYGTKASMGGIPNPLCNTHNEDRIAGEQCALWYRRLYGNLEIFKNITDDNSADNN